MGEIVSSDIVGMRFGSLFDATQTMVSPLPDGKTQVEVVSWYDLITNMDAVHVIRPNYTAAEAGKTAALTYEK